MDKMREEFEVWAISCEMCTYLDDDEYRHQSTEWAWRAWKSSRDALCVELPTKINDDNDAHSYGYDSAITDVEMALELSGVSYK